MKEQLDLLKKVRQHYNNPTYKEIASLSGIQLTRIFRLYNGFEMKLSEYLKLSSLIEETNKTHASLDETIDQCKSELSIKELNSLEEIVSRKLEIKRIVMNQNIRELA